MNVEMRKISAVKKNCLRKTPVRRDMMRTYITSQAEYICTRL